MDDMEEDDAEVYNYISFIAQSPSGTSLDIENTSRKLSKIFLKLYGTDQFPKILLDMLDANSNEQYININCKNATHRLYVVDRYLFHISLLCSLKYMKCIFSPHIARESNLRDFLRKALIHIINFIWIDKSHSLYLIRLLETIVKKREDILTPHLSLLILKCMNKVATSPHISFKHTAHCVSGIIINSLIHCKSNEFIISLDDLPIRGIQFKDASKMFTKEMLYENSAQIHALIIKLFSNNVESRKGSAYYETIMNFYPFEDFLRQIWPIYCEHLVQPEDDGEFYQSLLKYWIPINAKRYEIDFYDFLKNQNAHFNLKGYALLEMKKRGFHDMDATSTFLEYRKTSSIGLRILSTYTKKTLYPNEAEINAIKYYLNCYTQWTFSDDVLKSFRLFASQIFFACHIALSKKLLNEENSNLYQRFFGYVTSLCGSRIKAETCEMSAQILKIIWDTAAGSSSDLLIIYKLDRENVYGRGENLYYVHLNNTGIWQRIFFNQRLISNIGHFLGTSSKHCPKLTELVIDRYLTRVSLHKSKDLVDLLSETSSTICLLNSEKMRTSGSLILAQKKLLSEDFSGVIEKLTAIFIKEINRLDVESLFRCVLIVDVLLEMKRYHEVDIIFFIEKSLEFFDHIFEDSLHADFHIKTTKVLETFINNIIECLIISRNQWNNFHKKKVLNHLCTIIQKSNMKRPLSLSINVVQHFGVIMENDEGDREMKILLLQETLDSLYVTNKKQYTMIRRNPETRLVIHALCLSDDNPQKPYLEWALNYLVDVLASPSAPDVTVASALHCLEVLISDNSIQQFTIAFIPLITTNCINLFNRKSWLVRNADLQLLKALIERLFGVPLDYCRRYKSAEDLLILFPKLSMDFFEVLSVPSLKDDAIIALQFFSASKIENNVLIEETLERVFGVFERLFVYFIKNYPNHFGMLVLKSFAALCTESKIVSVFRDITRYIKQNFKSMNKNVFASLIILLEELHGHSASKNCEIQKILRILTKFLCKCNCLFLNLLSLKVYNLDHVVNEAQTKMAQETNFELRIWLNNYVIFVVSVADFDTLKVFLTRMLTLDIPEFLQIKMLSVLISRFKEIRQKESLLRDIAAILIGKLSSISDSKGYLVYSYAKTILWIFTEYNGICQMGLVKQIRYDSATKNIYKMIIYILILCNSNERNDHFIGNCLDIFLRYSKVGGDDEILFDISTVLTPMYKCSPKENRYKIFKLAFAMLVRIPTCFEICKFVSHLTSTRCSTVAVSLNEFLDTSNLRLFLGDDNLVAKLLLEFYCHVNELPHEYEESDTFYVLENDYTLSKMYLKKVIRCSLSNLTETIDSKY